MPESFWKLVLIVACVAPVMECEVFTSMAHLEATLYAERDIASTLRRHVQRERERLNKLEQLADDYAQHSQKALADPSYYLGNPVNAFLLIKRFTLDWNKNVSPMLGNDSWQELNTELQYIRQDLPTTEDLTGAAVALMRLQDTYNLDTSTIAHGSIGGVLSSKLTVEDCFQLGRLTYNEEDFYHTTLWMEEAMNRLGDKDATPAKRVELLDYLAFSYFKQGYIKRALTLTNELLELDPDHERAFNNKRYYEDTLVKQGENPAERAERPAMQRQADDYQQSSEFLTYEALCRGERTQKISNAHRLKCQYVHNNHPWLLLQPAKEEEMHLDPWIVMYHDVLSDRNIRDIQMLATPRLNRATVQNPETGILETATYRISKSAWLKGTDHPTIAKVNQKIEAITGLNMDTAEELQVANYGMGGHYEPHYDFAKEDEKDAFESLGTGNRIATFLNYMSDVEAGGATVFPRLGLTLYPKKGASAFWYNLYKSGNGIYRTRHAACPVLVGVKWVSNKWIHERGQEFRHPCSLRRDE
ncbi:prolyl 4-hydroxylase subunit alpha-1-like isoform X2 [Babylonia areolata]|uniref:prolyl 4-hydroxylase subunit alpha-1-like isoform X2 n=1 Tax=Babylonia areolata TaxID=304850 RepID=UPI003FD23223